MENIIDARAKFRPKALFWPQIGEGENVMRRPPESPIGQADLDRLAECLGKVSREIAKGLAG